MKALGELSPREIEHDNPEIRRVDELARLLGQLYNREVTEDDIVTVIRFSQIIGTHVLARVAARRQASACRPGFASAALLPGLADRPAEELGRAHRGAALLALDERTPTGIGAPQRGAAVPQLAPHCGHAAGSSSSSSRK